MPNRMELAQTAIDVVKNKNQENHVSKIPSSALKKLSEHSDYFVFKAPGVMTSLIMDLWTIYKDL